MISIMGAKSACASKKVLLFEDEEWRLTHVISPPQVQQSHGLARLQYVYVQKIGSPLHFFVGDYGAGTKGMKIQIDGAVEGLGALLTRKGVSFSYFAPMSLYTIPADSAFMETQDLARGVWSVAWEVFLTAELFPKGLKDYLECKMQKERWGQGTLAKKHLKKTRSF